LGAEALEAEQARTREAREVLAVLQEQAAL
jgi:hypothetical protein